MGRMAPNTKRETRASASAKPKEKEEVEEEVEVTPDLDPVQGVEDRDSLLDFTNIPKFKSYKQEAAFWKGRALQLRKCMMRFLGHSANIRTDDEGEEEERVKVNPTTPRDLGIVEEEEVEDVDVEEVTQPDDPEVDVNVNSDAHVPILNGNRVHQEGHQGQGQEVAEEVAAALRIESEGDGSLDLFAGLGSDLEEEAIEVQPDIEQVLGGGQEEEEEEVGGDGNIQNGGEEMAPNEDDPESPPVSPTATVFIPRSRPLLDDDEDDEEALPVEPDIEEILSGGRRVTMKELIQGDDENPEEEDAQGHENDPLDQDQGQQGHDEGEESPPSPNPTLFIPRRGSHSSEGEEEDTESQVTVKEVKVKASPKRFKKERNSEAKTPSSVLNKDSDIDLNDLDESGRDSPPREEVTPTKETKVNPKTKKVKKGSSTTPEEEKESKSKKNPPPTVLSSDSDDDFVSPPPRTPTPKVTGGAGVKEVVIVDKEKPSTSKKVMAEHERNKKKLARKDRDKKKLARAGRSSSESAARRGVLADSSSDEEGDKGSLRSRSPRKGKKEPKFISRGPISPEEIEGDARLCDKVKPVVQLVRLGEEIEAALKENKFILVPDEEGEEQDKKGKKKKKKKKGSSDEEEDEEVKGLAKLDREIRALCRFNARITKREEKAKEKKKEEKVESKKKDKDKKKKTGESGGGSGSGSDGTLKPGSELEEESDDDGDRPQIQLKPMADLVDSSFEELLDLGSAEEETAEGGANKTGKKDKKDSDKSKSKKKLITPQVVTSGGGGDDPERKGDRRDVLGADSDDSDLEDFDLTKSQPTPKRKKGGSTSEDSDAIVVKRTTRLKKVKLHLTDDSDGEEGNKSETDKKKGNKKEETKKKKKKGSDSDGESSVKIESSDSPSSNSDDSDFVSSKKKKGTKGKKGKRDHSSSGSDVASSAAKKGKKKKRKRIKEEKDSDDSDKSDKTGGDDSDIETLEVIPASQRRKKINHIMSDKDLKKSTREAEKEEAERKKRVAEKQKLFNGTFQNTPVADGKVTKLVLEIDPETKEPLIEVDESIVAKLKPHQADGIRFMYTTCFESIEQMKTGKGGGCILAHCMGLGKTLQTVAFTYTMLEHKALTGMSTCLVVCPLNTVGNWLKECQLWLKDIPSEKMPRLHSLWEGKNVDEKVGALRLWQKRGGIGIIHYDAFRALVQEATGTSRNKKKMRPKDRELAASILLNPGPDMIVCDEGHLLKNNKSKLSLALSQIKTIRRIVLTGTPLQNNLMEYHTMVNFVKPNLLGSQKEFTNRFANPIKNGQCKDSSERDVKVMKRRAHVLHSKLDGCVQRLDYSVLTPYLPAKFEYCITIKLSDKQKALYRDYLENHVSKDALERSRRLLPTYAVLIKILAHPVVLSMAKRACSDNEEESDEEGSLKDFICDDEADEPEESSTTAREDSDSDIECLNEDKPKKKPAPPPTRKTRSTAKDGDVEEEPPSLEKASFGFRKEWWSSHFEKKEDMYDTQLSGKLVVLQEILKICEAMEDRVLVFSQYLTSLDIIEEFLGEWDKAAETENRKTRGSAAPVTFPATVMTPAQGRWRPGLEYFRIDGATKTSDRQKSCETFNKKTASKAKLFLISTKAGGLGINLFGANRVVIFDASWNPSNDMQSIFRVYRFGQVKPCYIYRFVAQGTMEEKIYNRQVVKLSLSSRVIDEHQVERHHTFNDINEMYSFTPEEDEAKERETLQVPKDRLLADLLISHKNWITSYFEHDTLLVNKEDETLTEEERKQAWEEYQNEAERRVPVPNVHPNDAGTYQKIQVKIRERFPIASDAQIDASALIVLNKIQELRVLVQRMNYEGYAMTEVARKSLEDKIKKIQAWISNALGTPLDGLNGVAGGHLQQMSVTQMQQMQQQIQQQMMGNYPQYQYGQNGPGILRQGLTRPIPNNEATNEVSRQLAALAMQRMSGGILTNGQQSNGGNMVPNPAAAGGRTYQSQNSASAQATGRQQGRRAPPALAYANFQNAPMASVFPTTRDREMAQRQLPVVPQTGLSLGQLQARLARQQQAARVAAQAPTQGTDPDDPVTLD